MKRNLPRNILTLLLFATAVSAVVRVYVINTVSASGVGAKNYSKELSQLTNENTLLKEQIAYMSSLSNIKSRAISMGMTQSLKPDFLLPLPSASLNKDSNQL